jgi:hypothetical protein
MKSKLLQKKSDCLNKSREGLNGQQENTEDSSEPGRCVRLEFQGVLPTMWAKGKVLLRHQTVGPKKKAPVPRHAGFAPCR